MPTETSTPAETPATTSIETDAPASPPVQVDATEFAGGAASEDGLEEDFASFSPSQEDTSPVIAPAPAPVAKEVPPAPALAGDKSAATQPQIVPQVQSPEVVAAPAVVAPSAPPATAQPESAAAATPTSVVEPTKVEPTPAQANAAADAAVDETNPFASLYAKVGQSKEVLTKAIAEQVYKLSDDEVDQIQSEPQVVIPALMARLHLNVVENVLGTIAQQLPSAVNGMLHANVKHAQNENKFWDTWKAHGLDKNNPVHRQTFAQVARGFRQVNPQADLDTSVRMIGSQLVVALGLLPTAQPVAVQAPLPAQAFVPAAGNGTKAPVAPQAMSTWEEASQFVLDETAGAFDN